VVVSEVPPQAAVNQVGSDGFPIGGHGFAVFAHFHVDVARHVQQVAVV